MRPCVFCAIVEREIPASIVFENDDFIVLMDAYPLTKGHSLVIPKQHVTLLTDLKPECRQEIFSIGYKVMEAQKASGLGQLGTNILLNDGKAANQTVPHVHLHIIPREPKDLLRSLPRLALHMTGLYGLKARRSVLDQLANRIAACM